MAWEENSRICLHMQLIAILSRIGVVTCMSEVEYRLRNYNILFNGANTINKK